VGGRAGDAEVAGAFRIPVAGGREAEAVHDRRDRSCDHRQRDWQGKPLPSVAVPFDELVRAVRFGETVWGKDTPAESIDEAKWTLLIRRRIEGLIERGNTGVRATVITVSRLITVFNWLRKTKRIPIGAGQIDDEWKSDLMTYRRGLTGTKRDPEPYQPRFSLEEMRKIVKAAPFVDPRMAILLYVTAELGSARRRARCAAT
jgi:hypothetical protein